MVSHQNGGPYCQILFQKTWILYADSICQSKFYLEAVWTLSSIFFALALMPECISSPRSVMRTMGFGDGDRGTSWTKEYYYTMLVGYRVLD